jgi:transcriptional regulator with XRE-family HTH domain
MSDFPSALKAKIQEKGLNAADAAVAIGVSAPSLRTALAGKSFPNSRSLSKYAAFLEASAEDTKALIAASKPASGAKKAKGKKAKGEKEPKGKASRKAKGGSASAALEAIAAALKSAETLLNDPLAIAVSKLGAAQRRLIEGILKSIG